MLTDIYNTIANLYIDLFKYNTHSKPYIFNIYYGNEIVLHIDFALIFSYVVIFIMVIYICFLFFKIVRWFFKWYTMQL